MREKQHTGRTAKLNDDMLLPGCYCLQKDGIIVCLLFNVINVLINLLLVVPPMFYSNGV